MSANNFILRCEVKPANKRSAFKFGVNINLVDEARRKWFKAKKAGKRLRTALNIWWKVSCSEIKLWRDNPDNRGFDGGAVSVLGFGSDGLGFDSHHGLFSIDDVMRGGRFPEGNDRNIFESEFLR